MFNLIKFLFKKQIAAEVGRLVHKQAEYQNKIMLEKLCFLGLILFKRARRRVPGKEASKHIIMDAQTIASVDAVILPASLRKALSNLK